MTLPFLYQLQNATFSSLSALDFKSAVVDMDDSGLSAAQIGDLDSQDKVLFTYLSIGEAEDYRAYWETWDRAPPDFLLGENPNWAGNYHVKYWDPDWQDIVFERVATAVELGYDGMYLDIVDAYELSEVAAAAAAENIDAREAMVEFVVQLSQFAKSLDPNFKVIPQNAVGLLAANESDPGTPNAAYLNAIDGVGVEDLWYNDNRTSSWTQYDLEYLQLAVNADKFVLATSYPTQDAKQETFIANALEAGFTPFVGDRELTGVIDPVNLTIDAQMEGLDIAVPWLGGSDAPMGQDEPRFEAADADEPRLDGAATEAEREVSDVDVEVGSAIGGDASYGIDGAPEAPPVAGQGDAPTEEGASEGLIEPGANAAGDEGGGEPLSGPNEGDTTVSAGPSIDQDITPIQTNVPAPGEIGDDGRNSSADVSGPPPLTNIANILDQLFVPSVNNPISTAPSIANDLIVGTSLDDEMRGRRGDDRLAGEAGDDALFGGSGDDLLAGGDGEDMLAGGFGDDILIGGAGEDRLYGRRGADVLVGGDGDDTMQGGKGDDVLYAGSGEDIISGGRGHDIAVLDGARDDYTITAQGDDLVFTSANGEADLLRQIETVYFSATRETYDVQGGELVAAQEIDDVEDWLEGDLLAELLNVSIGTTAHPSVDAEIAEMNELSASEAATQMASMATPAREPAMVTPLCDGDLDLGLDLGLDTPGNDDMRMV